MTAAPAVEITGLSKVYGKARALDGVDLTVREGSVFGFLGPNGAGKTTTLRVLAGLARPSAGSARIFGHDVAAEAGAGPHAHRLPAGRPRLLPVDDGARVPRALG